MIYWTRKPCEEHDDFISKIISQGNIALRLYYTCKNCQSVRLQPTLEGIRRNI